jgi:hypothetical protein
VWRANAQRRKVLQRVRNKSLVENSNGKLQGPGVGNNAGSFVRSLSGLGEFLLTPGFSPGDQEQQSSREKRLNGSLLDERWFTGLKPRVNENTLAESVRQSAACYLLRLPGGILAVKLLLKTPAP